MKYFLPLALVVLTNSALAGVKLEKKTVFGATLRWSGAQSKVKSWLGSRIVSMAADYTVALDPDCYYRPQLGPQCRKVTGSDVVLKKMESLVKKLQRETGGAFNPLATKDGKRRRDFGGVAQGFFLEELARQAPGKWFGDFAGDIFISHPGQRRPLVKLTHPALDPLPYAEVKMKAGWLVYSSEPGWHKRDERLRRKKKNRGNVRAVALFARPDFNGARLDGWATAVVASGSSVLKRLQRIKEFKGKWAYVYFDLRGRPHCSRNLECRFKDSNNRKVGVPW